MNIEKPNITIKQHVEYIVNKLKYDIRAGEHGGKEHLPSIILTGLKKDLDKYIQILEILSKK